MRSCEECRKYVFKGGRILLDADGEPVGNPAPPVCERTPCGSREGRPRLAPWHMGVLGVWRACRQYRALPRSGGVLDQDEYMMELFAALDGLAADIEREELEKIRRRK